VRSFYNGYQSAAMEILKLNTLLYPESANVYDSYAEALKTLGKLKKQR